ncbi:ZP domain-containing protein [Trichonephila clavipes]|uniref:ZP domain-containing protein n=1 Tax=Trichonephila clavipes TaxID=2585209 RepID=A0A8X6V313_TRICX|nr:ZP domain-containing protein [Trichonephila clavipes]
MASGHSLPQVNLSLQGGTQGGSHRVTIQCKAREMIAKVKTSKVFNGRIYAKTRPNSCVADVANSVDFEIKMAYHDLNCDVKQENFGEFSNDIVIQHHDMIVTNQDLGLSVHCQYDLSNRSVSHGVQLEINGEVDATGTQSATVSSPNVTMMITDRQGYDITAAQVGDALALRFEIIDANS